MSDFSKDAISLVLACDKRYLPHAAVTLLSATEHCSLPIAAHLLVDDSVTSCRKSQFLRIFADETKLNITFHDVGKAFPKDIPCNRLPVITYFRFLIPGLFPETYDRCIYLDTDILVTGDLTELYRTDIGNAMLAGVPDGGIQLKIRNGEKLSCGIAADEYYQGKISRPEGYINAGVLLFQLNEIRNRGAELFTEMIQMSQTPFEFNDQDIINIQLQNEIALLDEKWNYQNNLPPGTPRTGNPLLFHHKPWCMEDIPHISPLYWEYLRRTPYYATVRGEYLLHALSVSVKGTSENRFFSFLKIIGNSILKAFFGK